MDRQIKSIGVIGTGNVAWHLAKTFQENGFSLSGVWSRSVSKTIDFVKGFDTTEVAEITQLFAVSDMIVIAVSDAAIAEVSLQLKDYNGIVVHTAGSVDMEALKPVKHIGVFYPLQTLIRNRSIDFFQVPILLESNSTDVLDALKAVANKISKCVLVSTSDDRLTIHTSAVFVNNFTNLMYSIGNDILLKSNFSIDLLKPLIAETAQKAILGNPAELQTGPARRNDTVTIEKHLKVLSLFENYSEIYNLLSKEISRRYTAQ